MVTAANAVTIAEARALVAVSVEDELAQQCRLAGLPPCEREARLIPGRRFRTDLAWVAERLAVEVDGGLYTQGRHTTGAGAEADMEKAALLIGQGWRVLRVSPRHVRNGQAVAWITAALGARICGLTPHAR